MQARGIFLAIIAGASFGLIPLFCIPVVDAGMGYTSIIFYRFLFGCVGMLMMMWYRQQSLRLTWGDTWRIAILSAIYVFCAYTLFMSYEYISSGISTALIYTNPIWVAIIGILFLKSRPTMRVIASILITFIGVAMLSGVFGTPISKGGTWVDTAWGLLLATLSGVGYGVYLVVLPRLSLKKMPSLKFTFYIFFLSLPMLIIAAGADCILYGGNIVDTFALPREAWGAVLVNLILLGLLPTAFSNICVTMALRMIDTTIVSVLGAFEPLTAMVIGVAVFHEPFDVFTIIGALLVLIGVIMITRKRT